MAKRQKELPNTRLDSEPKEQQTIAAIEDEIEALEKDEGKRTRIGQSITDRKKKLQALLVEHNLPFYEYEDGAGVLWKKFRKESLGSCKVKVEKRTDSSSGDSSSGDGDE